MNIIPALDILGGNCVRLCQGDYDAGKIYSSRPVEVAQSFGDSGLKCLHLVDLDGARAGSPVNLKMLEQIASQTSLQVDYGGGIKSDRDIAAAFNAGAAQVNIGSVAVQQPGQFMEWLECYGPDKIILSADCRNRMVASSGWQQESGLEILQFIRDYARQGVQQIVCTDISKDGMLEGPSVALYREILSALPLHLIASGGIRSGEDLRILKEAGCSGAIVGKAIYEGNITLKEIAALC